MENRDDYVELVDELIDRFGDIPEEVSNLMDISYIRALSSEIDIKNILQREQYVKLEFASADKLSLELIQFLDENYGKKLSFDLSSLPFFIYITKNPLVDLMSLVEKINGFINEKSNI